MALLTKDQILAADDRKKERVEVPEWGGEVIVRSLTGKERDDFEASMISVKKGKREDNLENFRARLVALCVVNEKGERLFVSRHDIAMLGQKSAAALERVYSKAQELNAFSESDVEELTEDFDEDPVGASTSG